MKIVIEGVEIEYREKNVGYSYSRGNNKGRHL